MSAPTADAPAPPRNHQLSRRQGHTQANPARPCPTPRDQNTGTIRTAQAAGTQPGIDVFHISAYREHRHLACLARPSRHSAKRRGGPLPIPT
jgi:hypothetical protein